ncbi:MAG: spermidine/putrescine transport system substrate-binding protein [Actinomycetota bacterium]|jgi:spermidine/putrescine transport system substrate-binding protein|nr:spermidine/putrescine transport system substrate-binding protein [Actinomycetota bacterium]
MSDPRNDPMFQQIVRAQLSRRNLLRGAGGMGAMAALAACGTGGGKSTTGSTASKSATKPAVADKSDTEKIVRWANWPAYLDFDEKTKKYPTLEEFQKKTGIKATYAEDIDGNDTYYGKIQGQLKNGQDIGKDVIVLTDWMAGRLIRQGYTQKLDKANIPNAKNLNPKLQNVDFDPGRNYSLTWQSGYAGIGYRKDKVGRELKTLDDLWAPDLKGKIVVLDEMRDTVGLIMMNQGKDISGKFSKDDFMSALAVLQKQVDSGQVRQVKGNSYLEDLRSGNAIAAIAWSGDILLARFEEKDDNYTFTLPESGGTLWSDNLMVPIASPHKKNAEKLIDYYYDPTVAATVAAYVNYICPVEGAKAEMEKIDKTLVDSPLIFPTAADLAKVKVFRSLTPDEETTFSTEFQKVIGA